MIDRAERALRDVFGLDAFRPGQSDVVAAMLAGRDVLSVAPTGSGKSISYWVPAVVDGGLTLVVSPLIALMKDQVDRLTDRGVAATFANSSVQPLEQQSILAAEGAPESLALLKRLDRRVDECGCDSGCCPRPSRPVG